MLGCQPAGIGAGAGFGSDHLPIYTLLFLCLAQLNALTGNRGKVLGGGDSVESSMV